MWSGDAPCCHCGAATIDSLFDMRLAAMLVPMHYGTLKKFLSRHKAQFPARYRLSGREHRRVRLLSGAEIKRIRAMTLRGPGYPTGDVRQPKEVVQQAIAAQAFLQDGGPAATGDPSTLP